jgi:hypothetical protein
MESRFGGLFIGFQFSQGVSRREERRSVLARAFDKQVVRLAVFFEVSMMVWSTSDARPRG